MNAWFVVAALVALGIAGAGGYAKGHSDGVTKEHDAAMTRENKILADSNAKIKALEESARAAEQAHGAELDRIATEHQKELADAERQKESDVAAARAGRIVLRIPAPACSGDPGRSGAGQVAASPGVGNGAATAELPREVSANLFALADDADSVVRQLTECQRVVVEDRMPR